MTTFKSNKDESELQDRDAVKKTVTPFGYSVYTSGATRESSVGCKTNKQ